MATEAPRCCWQPAQKDLSLRWQCLKFGCDIMSVWLKKLSDSSDLGRWCLWVFGVDFWFLNSSYSKKKAKSPILQTPSLKKIDYFRNTLQLTIVRNYFKTEVSLGNVCLIFWHLQILLKLMGALFSFQSGGLRKHLTAPFAVTTERLRDPESGCNFDISRVWWWNQPHRALINF